AFQHLPSFRIDAYDLRDDVAVLVFWYGCAEVTVAVSQRGNGLKLVIYVLCFAELFEIEKEECLVFAYRPANRKAIVIPSGARPRVRLTGLERISCVERFVHEIVVDRAVVLVGSRLHRDVEDTAADLTIFRSKVARLNCDFLNGVHTRLGLRRNARR